MSDPLQTVKLPVAFLSSFPCPYSPVYMVDHVPPVQDSRATGTAGTITWLHYKFKPTRGEESLELTSSDQERKLNYFPASG